MNHERRDRVIKIVSAALLYAGVLIAALKFPIASLGLLLLPLLLGVEFASRLRQWRKEQVFVSKAVVSTLMLVLLLMTCGVGLAILVFVAPSLASRYYLILLLPMCFFMVLLLQCKRQVLREAQPAEQQ